tara:strand:+ start:2791 stop:3609 length:819 start_codon:yes stop_codon:yes gene_type:complete
MKNFFLLLFMSMLFSNVDIFISDVSYVEEYVEVSIVTNEKIIGFQFEIFPSPNLNAVFMVEDIDLSGNDVDDYTLSGYLEDDFMNGTAAEVNGFNLFGDSTGFIIGFNLSDQQLQYIEGTGDPQVLLRVPWTYEVGQEGTIGIGENPRFIKPGEGGNPPQYLQTTQAQSFPLSIDYFDVPDEFQLGKAYPNPFNPKTRIDFGLPYNTNIELIIYGLDGRHIKTLIKSQMSSGFHSVEWNGTDDAENMVSSGLYIYQLIAGNTILSDKVSLVK